MIKPEKVACNEPNALDGLILEAAAFQIHPKTGKWYLILGAKILNWIWPSIKVGGVGVWVFNSYSIFFADNSSCNELNKNVS